MVNSAQTPAKSSDGNTHSPETLHLLARLREIGLNVITGAPNTPNCSSHVSVITTSDPEGMHIAKETYYVVMAGTSVGIFWDPMSFFCPTNIYKLITSRLSWTHL
ncbi:hypothetical protein L208DRAFT_1381044 [Tricholoma matsutake]|nr:hypothetical protein L208DRAFT_1381044 [Tricholoma matsutake 945]